MEDLARTFKSLSDPTRLRILRLLAREALSVGELTRILGAPQPSVSRQLGALKQAGLVAEERHGAYAFYRAAETGPVWSAVARELHRRDDPDGDLARLAEALRRRVERGGRRGGVLEPGRSWPAWARTLGWLIPPLDVADLGCGDGALTAEIARWAHRVVAVDHDEMKLAQARERLGKDGLGRVQLRRESLDALTLKDASFDVVVLSQALHYFDDPAGPLHEARRILRPQGRLLVLDLAPHGEDWVRDKLGHCQMGFRSDDLVTLLRSSGFKEIRTEEIARGPGEPFRVLAATGLKSAAGARKKRPGQAA